MSGLTLPLTITWLQSAADILEAQKAHLTDLDAAIGDSDHGENMARGFQAVKAKLATQEFADIGALFKVVGMTLISTVGGASGPLCGTLFMKAAVKATGKQELTVQEWADCLEAGLAGIVQLGKAQLGDKTMLDALTPAVKALQESADKPMADALKASAYAAKAGMEATIPLEAHKGRASYLGERSIGHQDPGATSSWILLQALADTVKS